MYLHQSGSASAQIQVAVGLAGNLNATAKILALGGGYTFETTVLGGAHYSLVAFLRYSWLDFPANVQMPFGAVRHQSRVAGIGDLTLVSMIRAQSSSQLFGLLENDVTT